MKATLKHVVKKVTLELIYDVVDERTKEIKAEMKEMRTEYRGEFGAVKAEMKEMRTEYREEFRTIKEDLKAINTRIDQIHMRLDQIMHMLAELRK